MSARSWSRRSSRRSSGRGTSPIPDGTRWVACSISGGGRRTSSSRACCARPGLLLHWLREARPTPPPAPRGPAYSSSCFARAGLLLHGYVTHFDEPLAVDTFHRVEALAGGDDPRRRLLPQRSRHGQVVRVVAHVVLVDELDPVVQLHVVERRAGGSVRRRLPDHQLAQRLASLGGIRAGSKLTVRRVDRRVGGAVARVECARVLPHQRLDVGVVTRLAHGVVLAGEDDRRAQTEGRGHDRGYHARSEYLHRALLYCFAAGAAGGAASRPTSSRLRPSGSLTNTLRVVASHGTSA